MRKRALSMVLLACLAACQAAPAPQPVRERPTIVSLNPCADAILAEVADPAQILALSHYSRDPRSTSMDVALARRFHSTGGTVEEVLALKPDVVVAGTFLAPATQAAFARLGIRAERFAIEHDVAQSMAQLHRLAVLAGHPERGAALARRIERALDRAAPPPGAPSIRAVMWQSGGIVPGEDTLVNDLMRRTGFASHSAARGLKQADALPLERMLADPPQAIFTAATPGDGEDRMLSHPALARLASTHHFGFDPALLYCGGPTIIQAAHRLAEARRRMGS